MRRMIPGRAMDRRLAALEIGIVLTIVAVVVLLAVPAFAARAKVSVLQQNTGILTTEVKSQVAFSMDPSFVADEPAAAPCATDPSCLSTCLALALKSGQAGKFVNPATGSEKIVSQSDWAARADGTPPAVLITDDQRCTFGALKSAPGTRSHLRGTLLVVFFTHAGRTSCLEVFYVDAAGRLSPDVSVVAAGT